MKRYVAVLFTGFFFYGVAAHAEHQGFDTNGRPIASPNSSTSRNIQAISNCLSGQGNPIARGGGGFAAIDDVGIAPAVTPDIVTPSSSSLVAEGSVLFQNRCVECHRTGSANKPGKPVQNKTLGASRVRGGSMPPSGGLPQKERDAIAAFLETNPAL